MKKLFTVLLMLLVISGAIFASGEKESSAILPGDEGSNGTQSVDNIKLEYYNIKNETEDLMNDLIYKFEKQNPGVQITQTNVPDAEIVLKTRLTTRDVPDIINCYPAAEIYKQCYQMGFLANLDGQDFLNQVPNDVLKMAQADGENFSLPETLSVYGIYIRTDLLKKYNLEEPETYDELINVCKELQKNGIIPFAFSDKDTWTIAQSLERIIGIVNHDSNSEFAKIANGEMDVNASPTLNALANMMIELHKYTYADTLSVSYEQALSDFINGKCAMIITGSWALNTFNQRDSDMEKKVELIPIPNPTGDETFVPINIDTAFAISSTTKYPDMCLKFVDFLAQTENAQIYADEEKTPNIIKGVKFNVDSHKKMTAYVDQGKYVITPATVWPLGLREQIKVPLQKLYMDNDVNEFLSSCGEVITSYYNN